MTNATEGRLRLTILGGYLGSGKTTWLRHQLHQKQYGRVHVIVNEAAGIPVDDALLRAADELTVLAGQCVCCEGQESLRQTLLRLCDERSRISDPSQRLEGIVLETSGLADPAAIITLVQDHPILARQIVITEIIVIVDALNARNQLRQETLSRAQIEAADRLILTKTEAADTRKIAELSATLSVLAPGAAQSATIFGSAAALPDIQESTQLISLPQLDGAKAAPIRPAQLDLGDAPDWTGFTVWLSALLHARGDEIVRVKGVVRTTAGRLLVQTVRKSVQSPEILPEPEEPCDTDNSIAVFGRGFTQANLEASFRQFSS